VDVCVVLLCVCSVGFLVCQDVVSLALWFEFVNVPLLGLICVRPVMVHGGKAWVGSCWLLCGYGVVSGIALLVGLFALGAADGH
jgi:hypothetical protein